MKSFVINLDRRYDRWARVQIELMTNGFNPIRVAGIDNKWRGCRDSHLKILEENESEVAFFIFEDDVLFLHDVHAYLQKALKQIPCDWDCLYLGMSPQEPQQRISDNLFKVSKSKCTHAILWHTRENGAIDYILNHMSDIEKWDVYLMDVIQPNFNCYCTSPMLATQYDNVSDTCKRSDVSTIQRNYNKYCK